MLERAEGPACRRCGCQDVVVLKDAGSGNWFGGDGRARCKHCGLVFAYRAVPFSPPDSVPITHEVVTPPPIEHQDPIIVAQRDPTPEPPKYQSLVCGGCGGKLVVTSSPKGFRRMKCKQCGQTYKLPVETIEVDEERF